MKRHYFTRWAASLARNSSNSGETPKKRRRVDAEVGKPKGGSRVLKGDGNLVVADEEAAGKRQNIEEKTKEMTIRNLPVNVLVKIFELVDLKDRIRVERTCRHWKAVARHHAWSETKKIDYVTISRGFATGDDVRIDQVGRGRFRRIVPCHRFNNNDLRSLLDRCGGYLMYIDLSAYRDAIDYSAVRFISQHCQRLESIDLTGIMLTNSSLQSLAISCPSLKSIVLKGCFASNVERGLRSLLNSCREIASLNFSENEKFTGECFDELPSTLLHVGLSGCLKLTNEAIKTLADRCSSLQVLQCDFFDWTSEQTLEYLFDHLLDLRAVHMSRSKNTAFPLFTAFQKLGKLVHLKQLYLGHNHLIDDTVICAVARGCPCLESLDISGNFLTDHSLVSLGRFAKGSLKRLNISSVSAVSFIGIQMLARCSKLHTLVMTRCSGVTDLALPELGGSCPDLIYVDVSLCNAISNYGVAQFNMSRRKLRRKFPNMKALCEILVSGSKVTANCFRNIKPTRMMIKLNFDDIFMGWTDDSMGWDH